MKAISNMRKTIKIKNPKIVKPGELAGKSPAIVRSAPKTVNTTVIHNIPIFVFVFLLINSFEKSMLVDVSVFESVVPIF